MRPPTPQNMFSYNLHNSNKSPIWIQNGYCHLKATNLHVWYTDRFCHAIATEGIVETEITVWENVPFIPSTNITHINIRAQKKTTKAFKGNKSRWPEIENFRLKDFLLIRGSPLLRRPTWMLMLALATTSTSTVPPHSLRKSAGSTLCVICLPQVKSQPLLTPCYVMDSILDIIISGQDTSSS